MQFNIPLKIQIVNKSKHNNPIHSTEESAGLDLRANLETDLIIEPGQRSLVSTGIFIALPVDYEAQLRPRSGLALKYGVTVLNSPGTIDSDYRGELKCLLINHGQEPFHIIDGDRIAQLVVSEYRKIEFFTVNDLQSTDRGINGYGSTGIK